MYYYVILTRLVSSCQRAGRHSFPPITAARNSLIPDAEEEKADSLCETLNIPSRMLSEKELPGFSGVSHVIQRHADHVFTHSGVGGMGRRCRHLKTL